MRTGKEGPEIIRGWYPLVAKSRSADQNAPPEDDQAPGSQLGPVPLAPRPAKNWKPVANRCSCLWPFQTGRRGIRQSRHRRPQRVARRSTLAAQSRVLPSLCHSARRRRALHPVGLAQITKGVRMLPLPIVVIRST
jgi:hypothetical protein